MRVLLRQGLLLKLEGGSESLRGFCHSDASEFSVSPEELVKEFEGVASEMSFKKKSKAFRIAMRNFIADFELKKAEKGGQSNNRVIGLHRSRLRGGPNRRPAPL